MDLHSDGWEITATFPDVHADSQWHMSLVRTLRIPDDDTLYPLPPGLGPFPVKAMKDLPDQRASKSDMMFPMYQAEALWLRFNSRYPFAIQIFAGRVNAVTGETVQEGLRGGADQNYLCHSQPWLDGFAVEKGIIRQFVAMPLGSGFTVEEQIIDDDSVGGIDIYLYPIRAERWEKIKKTQSMMRGAIFADASVSASVDKGMGLGQGGTMRQEIYEDEYDVSDYETTPRHFRLDIVNSADWFVRTGQFPPHSPPSAQLYAQYGLPWFDHYDEAEALKGSPVLERLKTVNQLLIEQGAEPLADNETIEQKLPVILTKTSWLNERLVASRTSK